MKTSTKILWAVGGYVSIIGNRLINGVPISKKQTYCAYNYELMLEGKPNDVARIDRVWYVGHAKSSYELYLSKITT